MSTFRPAKLETNLESAKGVVETLERWFALVLKDGDRYRGHDQQLIRGQFLWQTKVFATERSLDGEGTSQASGPSLSFGALTW